MARKPGGGRMMASMIACLVVFLEAVSLPAAAQDRLSAIRARGQLQVCMWPEYFAISYRNPRNGELEGIDIDMARALAARLGLGLRFVETNFGEFLDRLEGGDCDVAMMAVGGVPARQGRGGFSRPPPGNPGLRRPPQER